MTSQSDYSALIPDLILDALESVGLYAESGLLALNSYENRVYQFLGEDGEGQRGRWVVKFYRPGRWSDAQILEEHAFTEQLLEAEIPVVAPAQLAGQTLHNFKGYRFALFPSVGGRQFEVDNLDQLEAVGRFIGRLHSVSQRESFEHRPAIDVETYVDYPRSILKEGNWLPADLELPFFTIWDQIREHLAEVDWQGYQPIRLHGDFHPGNILWRDGPSFVDLDDCRSGPAIQDLWMMLNGSEAEQRMQFETLVEAYEECATLDYRELKLIEPLRALRMMHYMGWLAKRWDDPAFPHHFPWFGQARYWEEQILALKEQLAALQNPVRLIGQPH